MTQVYPRSETKRMILLNKEERVLSFPTRVKASKLDRVGPIDNRNSDD